MKFCQSAGPSPQQLRVTSQRNKEDELPASREERRGTSEPILEVLCVVFWVAVLKILRNPNTQGYGDQPKSSTATTFGKL